MHPTADTEGAAPGASARARAPGAIGALLAQTNVGALLAPANMGALLAPATLGALLVPAAATARTTPIDGLRALDTAGQAETLDAALAQGRAMLAQGQVMQALQHYTRALAQAPESVEAMNGAAVCYDRMGRFETSRTYYEMALGIAPQSALLLNNYGYSLFLQGDRQEAARFLSLAAAAGDPEVEARALKLLARMGAGVATASAAPASTAALPQGDPAADPRIVRTSDHELRLVLGDPPKSGSSAQASRLAGVLGPDLAAAVAPVGGLSQADDRRIATAEALAIRAELREAAEQREAARAGAETPADGLLQAADALGLAARAGLPPKLAADIFAAARPALPLHDDPEWARFQLLSSSVGMPAPAGRPGTHAALLEAGLVPEPRRPVAAIRPTLEPEARSFAAAFESDNARLNNLAARLHHDSGEPDVAEKIARLEALIGRMQALREAA